MPIERPEYDHFIAANEHGFYCVPRAFRDREVPKLLKAGEVYEPRTLRFLARHMGAGDVVTGGAFVGDFFPALVRGLAPGAMLHSFEPAPDTYAAARCTLQLNGIEDRVALHPVAVGEAEARLPLQIARDGADAPLAAGARLVDKAGKGQTIEVPVKTLDGLIPKDRKISILHLDIEGHELPALAGAKELIRDHAPLIVLETGKRRRRLEYAEFLNDAAPQHGYVHSSQIEENGIFVPLGARG